VLLLATSSFNKSAVERFVVSVAIAVAFAASAVLAVDTSEAKLVVIVTSAAVRLVASVAIAVALEFSAVVALKISAVNAVELKVELAST